MSWGPTGGQSSVHVNSVRQNTLSTRKTVSEETTTCIWFTHSYKVWHSTNLLKKTCMLCPNAAVRWAIKDKVLLVLHVLR